jgi:hypothetical protein
VIALSLPPGVRGSRTRSAADDSADADLSNELMTLLAGTAPRS